MQLLQNCYFSKKKTKFKFLYGLSVRYVIFRELWFVFYHQKKTNAFVYDMNCNDL